MALTGIIWTVGIIGWMIIGGWPFRGWPFRGWPVALPATVSRAAGSRSRAVSR